MSLYLIYAFNKHGRWLAPVAVPDEESAATITLRFRNCFPCIRITNGGDEIVMETRNGSVIYPVYLPGDAAYSHHLLEEKIPDLISIEDVRTEVLRFNRTLANYRSERCSWDDVVQVEMRLIMLTLNSDIDARRFGYIPSWQNNDISIPKTKSSS